MREVRSDSVHAGRYHATAIAPLDEDGRLLTGDIAKPQFSTLTMVVRSLRAADATMPTSDYQALDAVVDQATSPRRFVLAILGAFAGTALLLAALGVAVGAAVSLGTSRLLGSQLFGVGAADPVTFAGAAALLIAVAALAGYVPARRAAGIEPLVALCAP